MTEYLTRRSENVCFVTDHSGTHVATFSNNDAGRRAFQIFVAGIARTPSASLRDLDTGHYLAGDVGQLVP